MSSELLRDRLERRRRLPVPEAIDIARAIATALRDAHSIGRWPHRIAPDTIQLDGGRVLLSVALPPQSSVEESPAPDASSRRTALEQDALEPAYLSPEQLDGAPPLDARSDLYALGTVLFEMLAGRRPYASATAPGLAAERRRVPVPHVRSFRETVSPALDALVMSLLAVAPADRPASAEVLLAALDAVVGESDTAAVGQPAVTHVRDMPEVSPVHALRNAAIGVVLSLLALWLGVQLVGSR